MGNISSPSARPASQSSSGTESPSSSPSSPDHNVNEGSERERIKEFQPGSSMGCGGAHGSRRPPDTTAASSNPTSPTYTPTEPTSNMICDICSIKFTLINRKKLCAECRNYFCSTCLPRESGKRYGDRVCFRCKELNKSPPLRTELMKLRVKDLQNYLVRKHVNTKACVEKKDLVELVLQENGGEAKARLPPPTSSSWEDPTIRVSDQVPLERKNNFPKSYVESSHRREWFEKLSEDEAREVEETLVEEIGVEKRDDEVEETTVEPMEFDEEIEEVDEVISVAVEEDIVEDLSGATLEEINENETEDRIGASSVLENTDAVSSSETEQAVAESEVNTEEEEKKKEKDGEQQSRLEGAANRLNVDVTNDMPSSSPSSPRKFASHSMVYLAELESLDDLKELSSRQVKEILAMNRVNFKGCVEKEELLKIVERLWKQDQKSKDADVDDLDDDALCKICMDAPVDCVMLECGHMCTCTNCGKQMAECPICRQYVIRVVRTFKS